MKKFCVVALCALLAISSFGCKDKSRPADLPDDMSPCEITITQDGTPLAGATVDLQYTTNVKYNTSGVTDENGVAIMKTYGYAGAQQGTAKVRVDKLVTEGASEAEEYGEAGNLGQDFHLVDKCIVLSTRPTLKLRSVKRTPKKSSTSAPPFTRNNLTYRNQLGVKSQRRRLVSDQSPPLF